ncbi:hypothetical protein [Gracilibacillus sp. Marseille-QA3620]
MAVHEAEESGKKAEQASNESIEKKAAVLDAPAYHVFDIDSQSRKNPLNKIRSENEIKAKFYEELKKLPKRMAGKEVYNRVIPLMINDST